VPDVGEDAAEYRRLAFAWGQGDLGDPKRQNRVHGELHRVQKRLAATPEGQAAITALLYDEDAHVRLSAASHSLRWAEPEARAVLEALRDDPTDRSMAGFDAKYVLREHDAGRLTFDY
jgi:hypothetical protein